MTLEQIYNEIQVELGDLTLLRFAADLRIHGSEAARLLVALNGAPVSWKESREELNRKLLKNAAVFGRKVCQHLRGMHIFRFLTLTDQLFAIIFETIRNRGGLWYDTVIARVLPGCIQLQNGEEFYNWSLLKEYELQELEKALRNPKIDQNALRTAIVDVIASISWLFSNHLCIFSTNQAPQVRTGQHFRFVDVLEAADFDVQTASDAVESAIQSSATSSYNRSKSAVEASETFNIPSLDEFDPLLRAFTKPILITPPKGWTSFWVECREHYGELLPSEPPPQPAEWEWFTENADQIIVMPRHFLLDQPSRFAEYAFRQLCAVVECLRDRASLVAAEEQIEIEDLPTQVRGLAIPIGKCRGDYRSPFANGVPRRNSSWNFEMNCRPFFSSADVEALTRDGLSRIFLQLGGQGFSLPLRRSLELFEGALSLGHSGGALTEDVRVLWCTAALWTALEVHIPDAQGRIGGSRSDPVAAAVSRAFRSAGASKEQIKTASIQTDELYKFRNDSVHQGRSSIDSDKVRAFRQLVGTYLGICLHDCWKPNLHIGS